MSILRITSIPALVGIVGPIVVIVGDLSVSLSIPGYSPIRDTVSSLALTPLGWLQTICFLAMGLLFPIAILLLAPSFRSTPNWSNVFVYSVVAGVLAFGLIVGAFFTAQTGWFGLYERIIIPNALVWVEVVAIHYLRLLLRQQPKPQS
jgi:hypothetical protein